MRLAFLLLALAALAGCDSFPGESRGLELVVEQTRYAVGDEVLVVLDNDTGRQKTFSPCLVLVGPDSNRPLYDGSFCPDIAATIRPGQSIPLRFQLPFDLALGRYALAMEFEQANGVQSGRFEVVPAE